MRTLLSSPMRSAAGGGGIARRRGPALAGGTASTRGPACLSGGRERRCSAPISPQLASVTSIGAVRGGTANPGANAVVTRSFQEKGTRVSRQGRRTSSVHPRAGRASTSSLCVGRPAADWPVSSTGRTGIDPAGAEPEAERA